MNEVPANLTVAKVQAMLDQRWTVLVDFAAQVEEEDFLRDLAAALEVSPKAAPPPQRIAALFKALDHEQLQIVWSLAVVGIFEVIVRLNDRAQVRRGRVGDGNE